MKYIITVAIYFGVVGLWVIFVLLLITSIFSIISSKLFHDFKNDKYFSF